MRLKKLFYEKAGFEPAFFMPTLPRHYCPKTMRVITLDEQVK